MVSPCYCLSLLDNEEGYREYFALLAIAYPDDVYTCFLFAKGATFEL